MGKSKKTTIKIDEDTRLMVSVSKADTSALKKLYKKYFRVLINYIESLDGKYNYPEEIAQEAFTRVWQNKQKFRIDSSFKTYLFGFARNVLLEAQKRQIKEKSIHEKLLLSKPQGFLTNLSQVESQTFQAEVKELVNNAMLKLTPEQLQAIELFYNLDIPAKKAAKLANCSKKAFEKRLYRARKQLCRILDHLKA